MIPSLVVPSYLPAGFVFARAENFFDRDFVLVYERGSEQLSIFGTIAGARVRVAPGSYETLVVSGRSAFLVHGSWQIRHDPDGTRVGRWNSESETSLYFEHQGRVLVIRWAPPSALTTDAVMHVAESVQPYQG